MKVATSTPIAADEAWRRFEEWESNDRKIGVIFYGASGTTLYAMARVAAASRGRLVVQGDTLRASFKLEQAEFTYGPVQTWPRWPNPPIVEVIAIQAQLKNGDYLILAEGLRPESLPQLALGE